MLAPPFSSCMSRPTGRNLGTRVKPKNGVINSRFFFSGSSCNVEIFPVSCISTKNEGSHADEEVTKIWGFHWGAKRIRRYPADGQKKGPVGGLLGLKRVGSFRHQAGDGACRMTWSAQYSIALSLHQHTRQSHPLQLRVSLPRYFVSSACQTMYSGLPNSPPQPHSFKHRQPATLDISPWSFRS